MKNIISSITGHRMGFVSLLLVAVAAALGADSAFAMADVAAVSVGADQGFETQSAVSLTGAAEHVDPSTVQDADSKGYATVGKGAATATKADETDFAEEEIDKKIAQYDLFNFPFQWYIVNMARQVPVKTYHPKHYRNASAKLDLELATAVSASRTSTDDAYVLKFYKGSSVPSGDTSDAAIADNFSALKVYTEVFFLNTAGYDPKSTSAAKRKGFLAGYVVATDATHASVQILNPDPTATTLAIASGTRIFCGASAGSETQLVVPPDNFQPVKSEVYLQKKLSNIVWSKEWEEQAKQVKFVKEDLRNNALWLFKYKNAITHWLGGDFLNNIDTGGDLGEERVYFENGILNQINMTYCYDKDKLTPQDFNAIAKLQFTRFSRNSHAVAFCGANFLEKMQNMDVEKVQSVKLGNVEVTGGLIVKRWDSVFGQIDFVYDPILSEIGFSDFCCVFDMKEVTRYVKREQKTDSIDMSKTDAAREAKREMFSIIDCVALRGYNAVLVGPSDQIALVRDFNESAVAIHTVTAYGPSGTGSAYTDTDMGKWATGTDVVLLSADITESGVTYKKDSLLIYDLATSAWIDYAGKL